MIDADHYTPIDATLCPTGELAAVAGTPRDFRHLVPIGGAASLAARTDAPRARLRPQFRAEQAGRGRAVAGSAGARTAERAHLEVWTTEPGLQFNSGNS